MTRIAVVDDDPEFGQFLGFLLKSNGHEVSHFTTPGRFLDSLLKSTPDLVILDMHLPGMHGCELLRVLRGNAETKRLLVVAVSGEDVKSADAIRALDTGADEYLAKPLEPELLVARVAALIRRGAGSRAAGEPGVKIGPVVIRTESREVTLNGKPVVLTRLEYELLFYFMQQAGRVLTRGLILQCVWGGSPEMNTRTVDKHVESLRRKLGPFGANIETVVRVGYILKP